MYHLFYDTETTGLPIDYKAHVHEVDNWPRLVQLAWLVANDDCEVVTGREHIIKPGGKFVITTEASDVHGITTEQAEKNGVNILRALVEFRVAAELSDIQIGHNVNFDRKILGAEFIRHGMEDTYEEMKDLERVCTMIKSTKFCGLKNGNRPKWPKLQELYHILFDEDFDNAHDAMADVIATAKCYFELVDRGVIERKV